MSLLLFILLNLMSLKSAMAGEWSLNGTLQYSSGNYTTDTEISSFYFSAGLGYQSGRLSALVNIPFIYQNSSLVSRNGGIIMPSGHMGGGDGSGRPGPNHGGGMMPGETSTADDYISGLGDTYLFSGFKIVEENRKIPSVSIAGQMKIPTASSDLGTGKPDFGGSVNTYKQINLYSVFVDAGIWIIGDTDSIDYRNPLTFGAGVGRIFSGGKYSAMIYFQAYSRTIEELDPPMQVSLSVSRFLNKNTFLSVSGSAGLSETSSDFILSTGIYTRL